MQAGVGLLVSDVMPIYMIIPRYSHNYAQFCQLLNSNFFTHRRILMLSREATSETYGPRVYLHHINLPILSYFLCFLFLLLFYFASLSQKYQKYYPIISIRSHSRKWPWRDWQPLIALVARSYLFCVGARDSRVASYWIDTLVLKNWGKYLRYYCCITLSSSRKTNASSRRSKKDFWRRCRGGLRSSQDIPSTHHKLISLAFQLFAICLSFSSPPLPLAVLFVLSFPISFSLSFACLFVFACVSMCLLCACIFAC